MAAKCLILTAVVVCVLLSTTQSQAQLLTTFDTGLDGWTVTGEDGAAWDADAGNPGGCLSINDEGVPSHNYVIAPLSHLGDWSAAGPTDSLVAEVYCDIIVGYVLTPAYIFRLEGPGGAARALIGSDYIPVQETWNRYAMAAYRGSAQKNSVVVAEKTNPPGAGCMGTGVRRGLASRGLASGYRTQRSVSYPSRPTDPPSGSGRSTKLK